MLKDIFSALPVEGVCKILSNELNLEVDFSDFNKDAKASSPSWKSNKENVNSISMLYELNQLSGGGMTFGGSYLVINYSITIKTASGSSKIINLRFPEKEKTAYNPMYVAREKGLNSADVAKVIIMEEVKNIPARLIASIKEVCASGSYIYSATNGGLSVSANNGSIWITYTNSTPGFGDSKVYGVSVSGSNIYAATWGGGLSVSANNGSTWTTYTASTLGINSIMAVYVSGTNIYASTWGIGLTISNDNGSTWNNYTKSANGLADDDIWHVYALGSNIYAATGNGLSISTNSGNTWTNYTNATNGFGSKNVTGVYVQ